MSDLLLAAFDVVVLPFPFTDRDAIKRRPALVVSQVACNQAQEHSVLAMITSAEQSAWAYDYSVVDWETVGLPKPCVVRFKLFTLDHRLVIRRLGRLSEADQKQLKERWSGLLAV
jgi:mRNA interferase MazF